MPNRSLAADSSLRWSRLLATALAAWCATSLFLLVIAGAQVAQDLGDADDALRLQQIRDLLFGGQGWYDLVQHRFNPPDGVFIHWSRLIDVPIAGLILALKPFIGLDRAEIWTRAFWPLLPILPLMIATGAIAGRLGDGRAAIVAILFTAIACSFITLFRPGRIDHHNVQLAATLVVFACLMAGSASAAILAGLVAALMLAIGMETLPYSVLACAIAALRWAIAGESGAFLRRFFIAFAIASLAFFALTVAPSRWLEPACDLISPVYLAPLILGAVGFGGFSRYVEAKGLWARLALCIAIGLAAPALVATLQPTCLKGPLAAMDPRLVDIWLSKVGEARSALSAYRSDPDTVFVGFAMPLAAAIVGFVNWRFGRAGARRELLLVALLLAVVSLLVGLWQVRAVAFANMFAVPVLAAALVRGADAARQGSLIALTALCGIVNPLTLPLAGLTAGTALPLSRPAEATPATSDYCSDPREYAALATLKPGVVAAPVEMGSFIIATSGHAVLGAPYHRNTAGILDMDAILTAPDATALAVAQRRNVDYFAYCAWPAAERLAAGGTEGLEARLQRGTVPAWLKPVASNDGSRVRIYRVLK